jgi:hypothetical protein
VATLAMPRFEKRRVAVRRCERGGMHSGHRQEQRQPRQSTDPSGRGDEMQHVSGRMENAFDVDRY